VRSSSVLCIMSPTPATVLVAAHHAAPATCTPRDKQTRFFERNKDKRKTKQNVPHLNSNLVKSMTHHNQTKELTIWFLTFIAFQSRAEAKAGRKLGTLRTDYDIPPLSRDDQS
jgi:hypothetical protein